MAFQTPAVGGNPTHKYEVQMTKLDGLSEADAHYLNAILLRLEALYEMTQEPNIREQLSDEVDWIRGRLGR